MITTLRRGQEVQTQDDIMREAADRFRLFIKRTAHRIADGDDELVQDLEQEALIVLWKLDPTRFGENEVAYLRGAMRRRMKNYARGQERAANREIRVEVRLK